MAKILVIISFILVASIQTFGQNVSIYPIGRVSLSNDTASVIIFCKDSLQTKTMFGYRVSYNNQDKVTFLGNDFKQLNSSVILGFNYISVEKANSRFYLFR